jgi:hypothetical protein
LATVSSKIDVYSEKSLPNSRPTKIEDLPGIGKKLAQRILTYYGTDEAAMDGIRNLKIGQIPGFSYKHAVKFARQLFEAEEGVSPEAILKTPDINAIYEDILLIFAKYAKTEYSKAKIQLYFPLPSYKTQLIRDRQIYCQTAIAFTQKYRSSLENKNFSRILYQLGSLVFPDDFPRLKKDTRIILTENLKWFEKFDDELPKPLNQFVTIERINFDKHDNSAALQTLFDSYCKNFDVVIYIGQHQAEIPDFPNLISYSPDHLDLNAIFPEKICFTLASNQKMIDAAIKTVVHLKTLKEPELLQNFIEPIDLKKLKLLKDILAKIDENGGIAKAVDPDLDEYQEIASKFTGFIINTENEINQLIQNEIGARSIRLEGKQILEFFRADLTLENIRNYIPPEVDQLISENIEIGIESLKKLLKLTKSEQELFSSLRPEIIEYPIVLSEDAVKKLEKKVRSRVNMHQYQLKMNMARILQDLSPFIADLLHHLVEFEFFYAVGQMSMDFKLSIPELIDNSASNASIRPNFGGFYGSGMINLDLMLNSKSREGHLDSSIEKTRETPVPIGYQIGQIGPESVNSINIPKKRLALLTGSNSGGKTMALLTCIEAQILAQMGFPTLGEYQFYPFDELYFFKKSSGQISAGAFETTLLQFVQLAQSNRKKIVFADELEAITEPNAAAKVMAGIFQLFLENTHNYGIFVTHLVDFIMKELDQTHQSEIRIDGIEAAGLDENLNLIIDRNPRYNFVAKSTPELILKRLANSGNIAQKTFFQSILQKF